MGSSLVLWALGDAISQTCDGNEKHRFSKARLIGTALEGCLVGGGIGSLWYERLHHIVAHTLKLRESSFRFVLAKIGLECFLWQPTLLLSFWLFVGLFEGHPFPKIRREIQNDFLPALLSGFALFIPLDVVNFRLVPVQYQVLVSNAASLVEAVGLSYIHAHGFPGLAPPPAAGGAGGGTIAEAPAIAGRVAELPSVRALLEAALLGPLAARSARAAFAELDPAGAGSVPVAALVDMLAATQESTLPGVRDPVASRRAAALLVRKADVDGDGTVTLGEYLRMVEALRRTNYKEEMLGDVVHALFDSDGDGFVDRTELGRCVAVLLGPDRAAAKADAAMLASDRNRDGRLSPREMRAALLHIAAARDAK